MQRRLSLILACCLAFPIVAAAQSVSPDALLQKSRVAQDKAFEEMSKFYDCTARYVERNISPNTTATEIADAAVASCNSHVTFYVGYMGCCRFRGHPVKVETETGGRSWERDGNSVGSSSLRP
jgi:hypothetical protein